MHLWCNNSGDKYSPDKEVYGWWNTHRISFRENYVQGRQRHGQPSSWKKKKHFGRKVYFHDVDEDGSKVAVAGAHPEKLRGWTWISSEWALIWNERTSSLWSIFSRAVDQIKNLRTNSKKEQPADHVDALHPPLPLLEKVLRICSVHHHFVLIADFVYITIYLYIDIDHHY